MSSNTGVTPFDLFTVTGWCLIGGLIFFLGLVGWVIWAERQRQRRHQQDVIDQEKAAQAIRALSAANYEVFTKRRRKS